MLPLYLAGLIWNQIGKGAARLSAIGIILISYFALTNEAIKGRGFVEYVFAGAGFLAFGAMAANWLRTRLEKNQSSCRADLYRSYCEAEDEQSTNSHPRDIYTEYLHTDQAMQNSHMRKKHLTGATLNVFLTCAFAMVAAGTQIASQHQLIQWKMNNLISLVTILLALIPLRYAYSNIKSLKLYNRIEKRRKAEIASYLQE